jgi:3'(2'), 5'-bisphosphate nucleotidase
MNLITFSEELTIVKEIIKKAGKEVMRIYEKNDFSVKEKDDYSPVSEADISSNKIIIQELKKRFSYPIISEESENKSFVSNSYWIIDPLDGTKNFVKRDGEFSIMIGLIKAGELFLGVVYVPAQDELYFAEKGKGSYMEKNNIKTKLQVTHKDDFSNQIYLVSKNHFSEIDKKFLLFLESEIFIQKGSIGIKVAEICKGTADIYFNFDGLNIWDLCAPQIILEEAGGEAFDLKGQPFLYSSKKSRFTEGIVLTNGQKKDFFVQKIKEFISKKDL